MLAQPLELLERAPVDEREVAHVGWDVHVGKAAQDAVEERARDPLEEPLRLLPLLADRVHDLVALRPAVDQLESELGRILEVAVHDHDRLPRRRSRGRQ